MKLKGDVKAFFKDLFEENDILIVNQKKIRNEIMRTELVMQEISKDSIQYKFCEVKLRKLEKEIEGSS